MLPIYSRDFTRMFISFGRHCALSSIDRVCASQSYVSQLTSRDRILRFPIRCELVVQVFTSCETFSPVERVSPSDTLPVGIGPKFRPAVEFSEVMLVLSTMKADVALDMGFIISSSSVEFRYRRQISWNYSSCPSLPHSASAPQILNKILTFDWNGNP